MKLNLQIGEPGKLRVEQPLAVIVAAAALHLGSGSANGFQFGGLACIGSRRGLAKEKQSKQAHPELAIQDRPPGAHISKSSLLNIPTAGPSRSIPADLTR